MKLSFLAKDDLLVVEPGTAKYAGQQARYINRVWDEARHGFPAVDTPFTCDSDSDDGRRLSKLARRDESLLPADVETAAFLGVDFVPMRLSNGVWVAAPPAKAKTVKGSE